jgi:hypothetical protein
LPQLARQAHRIPQWTDLFGIVLEDQIDHRPATLPDAHRELVVSKDNRRLAFKLTRLRQRRLSQNQSREKHECNSHKAAEFQTFASITPAGGKDEDSG